MLLIHGDKDATVPLQQSEIFKTKCEAIGLPVDLGRAARGRPYLVARNSESVPVGTNAWFDRYLKK